MNIGFVGLGIMGLPMAGNLLRGGHALYVFGHQPPPRSLLEAGAVGCASSKEVAERAEVVITMVQDTPHVASALFDESGVAQGLSPGKIVVT